MKKLLSLILLSTLLFSKSAKFEIEGIPFAYIYDGYHISLGISNNEYRVRLSCLKIGSYDIEENSAVNGSKNFERYYDHGSYGLFLGYYIYQGFHIYGFIESHNWKIKNTNTNESSNMKTIDIGPGIGYQFFINKSLYIQPAYHIYFRKRKKTTISNEEYKIPNIDRSFILRIGYRF